MFKDRRKLLPRERPEPLDPLENADPPTHVEAGEKEQIIRGYRRYPTLGSHETDPNFRRAAMMAPKGRPYGPTDDLIDNKVRTMVGEI